MPGVRGLGMWEADAGIGAAFADVEALAERCPLPGLSARERAGLRRAGLRSRREALRPSGSLRTAFLNKRTEEVRERREEARRMRGEKASDVRKKPIRKGKPRRKR